MAIDQYKVRRNYSSTFVTHQAIHISQQITWSTLADEWVSRHLQYCSKTNHPLSTDLPCPTQWSATPMGVHRWPLEGKGPFVGSMKLSGAAFNPLAYCWTSGVTGVIGLNRPAGGPATAVPKCFYWINSSLLVREGGGSDRSECSWMAQVLSVLDWNKDTWLREQQIWPRILNLPRCPFCVSSNLFGQQDVVKLRLDAALM